MDRYQTKPSKPKVLAKSTLNRLADPVKGRHESPQKTRINDSRPVRKVAGISIPSERVDRRQQQYHNPLKENDYERRPSPITTPRKKKAPKDKEADSFFLTGLMNGESDDEPDENSHRMNVRVQFKHGENEIYSPRTLQYMKDVEMEAHQEELLRQVQFPSPKKETRSFRESMEERGPKISKSGATARKTTRNAGKKVKTKVKAKTKLGMGTGTEKKRGGYQGSSVAGSIRSSHTSSRNAVPVPIAGIRSTRRDGSLQRKQRPQANLDPLVGLERVDGNAGAARGGGTLLRSSSGVGMRPSRQLSKNAMGTRSAPTLSKSRQPVKEEEEDGEPPYRVDPMASKARRLLGRAGGSQSINKMYGDKLQRSGVGPVKLQPMSQDKPVDIPRTRRPPRGGVGAGPPPVLSAARPANTSSLPAVGAGGGIADSNRLKKAMSMKAAPAQLDPNDDQLASLFAAHAKKLSASLEKADQINAQYKSLRNFDGYLYASRHNVDTMIPKSADKSTRGPQNTEDNSTSAPTRLKIVI
jgi:hypothetical protein